VLSRPIDLTLVLLKWPLGIASALLIPGAVMAWGALLSNGFVEERPRAVLLGLVGYWVAWLLLFRRRSMGSALSTLEHELTHALFATLTFHRVKLTSIRTSWNNGGEIAFHGEGNWLIYLAPYFFPTLTVGVAVWSSFQPGEWVPYAMGATWAYHATSTWRETHAGQTDLQRSGWVFSWLFLPGANLVSMGGLLAVALGGAPALEAFLTATWTSTEALFVP
jgi:hypothetical protein